MNYLNLFLISLATSGIGAYPIYRLLIVLKSRQTVSQYAPEGHQKKQGTPTMGGMIVIFGFIVGSLPTIKYAADERGNASGFIGITLLFAGFALIGFIDDFLVPRLLAGKRGLGWKQKILMQLGVAVGCGSLMCGGPSVGMGIAVFLILFFSNAYNFSDGLDGLAGSLLIFLGGGLTIIAYNRRAEGMEAVLAPLLGAILPFLFLNKPKAKVFMGDVGSLPIGAVLGTVISALAMPSLFRFAYPASNGLSGPYGVDLYRLPHPGFVTWIGLVVISGVMIVELIPVPLQILSVKLRKKRLFSFTPIHHAYERKGWSEIKVVAAFVGSQFVLSSLAVAITYFAPRPEIGGYESFRRVMGASSTFFVASKGESFLPAKALIQPGQVS